MSFDVKAVLPRKVSKAFSSFVLALLPSLAKELCFALSLTTQVYKLTNHDIGELFTKPNKIVSYFISWDTYCPQ